MRRIAQVVFVLTLAWPAAGALGPDNVATLATRWTKPGGGVTGDPVLRDGRVYVGAWDGKVFALDPATGTQIWSRDVGGPVSGAVTPLDDGGICYGTLSGTVGCLDGATGAVRWTTELSDPAEGRVWSGPLVANGRVFAGIAGLTDQPCTRGRLVALDLADGHELWRFYTIPEKICTTDTATACTTDGDCPSSGTCIEGQGAGVTATPTADPSGTWVYMNTVGCYTFPSIGESDSMFKIDAATGTVAWRNRVSAPEQFGACENDTGIDCGTDGDCGLGNVCTTKAAYHDFGFVNGPLRIEVPDGIGGTKPLIVSGSKNGTLYAFDEATGDIAWANVVRVTPITPSFAGFGLFNGALAYADGRLFAALYQLAPARVCSTDGRKRCDEDADCVSVGGTCPAEPKHLMAFDAATGDTLWEQEIGASWSHVAVANGVVYAGTQATDGDSDASWLYAHDAGTGERLGTFSLPAASAARPLVAGDSVIVGYGITGGGVLALSLCGNGVVDPGETCDVGPAGNACCSPACALAAVGTACDDADACTGPDTCTAQGACTGSIASTSQVACSLDAFEASPCGGEMIPKGLAKAVHRGIARVERLLGKAVQLGGAGKTDRAEHLRTQAGKALDAIGAKVTKAAASRKTSKRISAECRATFDGLISSRRAVLDGFPL
jgi:outer membrane protein assembly factor BamB